MRISKNVLNSGLITFDVKANHQTTMYASASTEYSKGRLRQAMMNGMGKILRTYDTYSRKDDLDKKLLEVAKIIGRRLEKRFDYLAMKLKEMLIYETS
ncbi:unnamed protein product [Schistosoma bovis]|nr:unnamed protein product [Schistosoma bovis]